MAQDILDKIPKKTPSWAVGVVSIIISIAALITVVYTTVRPEVQQTLSASIGKESKELDIKKDVFNTLLNLAANNAKQIADLNAGLFEAQKRANLLADRITAVETELNETKLVLGQCKKDLAKYKHS